MADPQSIIGALLGIAGAAMAGMLAHRLATDSDDTDRGYSRLAVDFSAAFFGFEVMRGPTTSLSLPAIAGSTWIDFSQPTTRLAAAAILLLLALWIAKSKWDNAKVRQFVQRGGTAAVVAVISIFATSDNLSADRKKADLTLVAHEALQSFCSGDEKEAQGAASVLANLALSQFRTSTEARGSLGTHSTATPRERRHSRWAARREKQGKTPHRPESLKSDSFDASDLCQAVDVYQRLIGTKRFGK